jgi:integrase
VKLTDISIRNLPLPESGQKTYFDDTLKGFGVRCSQGGTKSYVVVIGTTRRLVTLGKVGVVGLKDARQLAKEQLASYTLHGRRQYHTKPFSQAKDEFLAECGLRNKPRTVKDYTRILNSHFKFGRTQLEDITQADVLKRIDKLKKTPREHAHAFTVARAFFRWCARHRYIEMSPIEGLKPPPKQPSRTHTLSDKEFRTVFKAARKFSYPFGHIVSLLILTGQRRGEIAALKWDWIDREEHTISLPPEVTKNGREHLFPIGELALEVLEEIPESSEYLFPAQLKISNRTTVFNGWGKPKARFDAALENVRPFRLHDLRRTFSTAFAQLGIPIHITEQFLNHKSGSSLGGIAGVYNKWTYLPEMREAVETYEQFIKPKQRRGQ